MDSNMIIQQGELAKYLIASQRADLVLNDVDFYIVLEYGMMGKKLTIAKSELQQDADGNWVMMFDTSEMVGKVTARLFANMTDGDTESGTRCEVDCQMIAFVVSTPCPRFFACPSCESAEHDVTYTRTEESSIVSLYYRLCDFYHHPLVTSDGMYLCVLKTAVEDLAG